MSERWDRPKEKIILALLKSKKELTHDPYLKLSSEEAFKLALDISNFMLYMRKNKNGL